jgi:hypothetical protein
LKKKGKELTITTVNTFSDVLAKVISQENEIDIVIEEKSWFSHFSHYFQFLFSTWEHSK